MEHRESVEGARWPWGNDAWLLEVSPDVVPTTFPVYWTGDIRHDDMVMVTSDWKKVYSLPTKKRAEEVKNWHPNTARMMAVQHSVSK